MVGGPGKGQKMEPKLQMMGVAKGDSGGGGGGGGHGGSRHHTQVHSKRTSFTP